MCSSKVTTVTASRRSSRCCCALTTRRSVVAGLSRRQGCRRVRPCRQRARGRVPGEDAHDGAECEPVGQSPPLLRDPRDRARERRDRAPELVSDDAERRDGQRRDCVRRPDDGLADRRLRVARTGVPRRSRRHLPGSHRLSTCATAENGSRATTGPAPRSRRAERDQGRSRSRGRQRRPGGAAPGAKRHRPALPVRLRGRSAHCQGCRHPRRSGP